MCVQDKQEFLTPDQIEDGYVLVCVAKPLADCTLVTEVEHPNPFSPVWLEPGLLEF